MEKIYKVRLWVLEEKRGGGFKDTPVEDKEQVVIGNSETAERVYKDFLSRYKSWCDMSKKYRGFVELYEAFINPDGTLSTYPEGIYIDRKSTEK